MPSVTNSSSSTNAGSTPATSAPSIVQQRIALIAFLVVISALVWWQDAGGDSNHPVQKFSTTPAPKAVAELDFSNAEASWSSLQIDAQGNLKIDASTESALLDIIALVDQQNSQLQMQRIAFLLEKQFGASASQQVIDLLPIFENYKKLEQRWWEENGGNLSANEPPPYAELFQLQDELLGKTLAAKLFSEQRRVTEMMLASQRIQNDSSLTQAEKDQALQDLQNIFQEGAPIE